MRDYLETGARLNGSLRSNLPHGSLHHVHSLYNQYSVQQKLYLTFIQMTLYHLDQIAFYLLVVFKNI